MVFAYGMGVVRRSGGLICAVRVGVAPTCARTVNGARDAFLGECKSEEKKDNRATPFGGHYHTRVVGQKFHLLGRRCRGRRRACNPYQLYRIALLHGAAVARSSPWGRRASIL